ncbi:Hachiman antiphage defense system protein HamA [Anaeromyxobacter terrae]|uniref:Hachiman antiphage defense system protein HamA n=1 Tax=Anaeromyxobacter terrae TaxID=2925406 RepID=UPI001F580611|nr:Hachiman antiphage defense system protein HamA [Anaeromyxobacter sp. SG22]
MAWLVDPSTPLKTADGRNVQVLELRHQKDEVVLRAWAKHFRSQYCDDGQIDALRDGTGLSRAEYLRKIKFPDQFDPPGPSIRSGDFAEVLVADYVEFALGFWVPRTRYNNKTVRNESTKGSDIIGFLCVGKEGDDAKDTLAVFESKASLGSKAVVRLKDAIEDSAKDEMRKAESLNAIKQRLLDGLRKADAKRVERFQNLEDRPYREVYGAAAVVSCAAVPAAEVAEVNASAHPKTANLVLMVINGIDLMDLVHELYRRAADEA